MIKYLINCIINLFRPIDLNEWDFVTFPPTYKPIRHGQRFVEDKDMEIFFHIFEPCDPELEVPYDKANYFNFSKLELLQQTYIDAGKKPPSLLALKAREHLNGTDLIDQIIQEEKERKKRCMKVNEYDLNHDYTNDTYLYNNDAYIFRLKELKLVREIGRKKRAYQEVLRRREILFGIKVEVVGVLPTIGKAGTIYVYGTDAYVWVETDWYQIEHDLDFTNYYINMS